MKAILGLVAVMSVSNAWAIQQEIRQRDLKLPTQQMVEKQSISNPSAANSNGVLSGHAGATSQAAVTVSSFAGQPDVPRNLVVTPGGTTAHVGDCDLVVIGDDMYGDPLLEVFAFAPAQATAITGSLAFRTVSEIIFPGSCETGGAAATWSVGLGEKLGLKRCMDYAHHLFHAGVIVGSVGESVGRTVAAGQSVASSSVDFNASMNGSNDFEVFFFQNFICQ